MGTRSKREKIRTRSEKIDIISRTYINKIRNILNQRNALLEPLLTCFIKKFSKDLWTHIKRWHNDNENNKKIMLYCYTKQTITKAIRMIVIKSKTKRKEKKPLKIDQIAKVVERFFFV